MSGWVGAWNAGLCVTIFGYPTNERCPFRVRQPCFGNPQTARTRVYPYGRLCAFQSTRAPSTNTHTHTQTLFRKANPCAMLSAEYSIWLANKSTPLPKFEEHSRRLCCSLGCPHVMVLSKPMLWYASNKLTVRCGLLKLNSEEEQATQHMLHANNKENYGGVSFLRGPQSGPKRWFCFWVS